MPGCYWCDVRRLCAVQNIVIEELVRQLGAVMDGNAGDMLSRFIVNNGRIAGKLAGFS